MKDNEHTTKSNSIVLDQLRQEVLFGKLAPGSFIRQDTMAKRFGVSRTPVREALKALESEGLLENLPERGYRIRKRTLRELIEIIDVRALLEGYAAKLAAMTAEANQIDVLYGLAEKIDSSRSRYLKSNNVKDFKKWSHQEQEFHYTIIKASQNQFLIRLVRSMDFRWADLLSSDAHPNPQDDILPTHYQIAESIEGGDSVNAEKHARRHVSFYKLIGVESKLGPTVYWDIQP